MSGLLEVDGLCVGYGSLSVLHGVSFTVEEGQTTVLLGLNGAGKTTTVNTIAGLLTPQAGRVRLAGKLLSGLSPADVVRHGVALCPEGRRVFPSLSVRTNLELGSWTRPKSNRQLDQVLDYFPALTTRLAQPAGTLSGGEQQMLAVARALMSNPRLLLVDEASLGLAPIVAQALFEVIHRINANGTTVVAVEQNAGILQYANRVAILEKGTVVFDGTSHQLHASGGLISTYLGEALKAVP